jgi:hypothetical protein
VAADGSSSFVLFHVCCLLQSICVLMGRHESCPGLEKLV